MLRLSLQHKILGLAGLILTLMLVVAAARQGVSRQQGAGREPTGVAV